MNVFVDLHHFDLFYSFQKLFEDRLGWNLYRPIGYEWRDAGYWYVHNHQLIQQGYLGEDVAFQLDRWESFEGQEEWARHALELLRVGDTTEVREGHYLVEDKSKQRNQHAITLGAFRNIEFDIVISSLPWHFGPFESLIQNLQPQAKHIFQAGNIWDVPQDCKNMMCSTLPKNLGRDVNVVRYRQEFDLDIFSYKDRLPAGVPRILSYVHFPESEQLLNLVRECFHTECDTGFVGKTLGLTKDIIVRTQDLAESLQKSAFVWHVKPGGEGYGHILHNSFAVGTPIVTSLLDYKGFCGEELLVEGETFINIDHKSPDMIAQEISELLKNPDQYQAMRQRVRQQFEKCVDFDKEFLDIQGFLGRLK